MDWSKVVTDPLGLVGFVLALAFGAASQIVRRKHGTRGQWMVIAAYVLAAVSVVSALAIAYRRVSPVSSPPANPLQGTPAQTAPAPAAPSLAIDRIEQHGNTNIAGVQGGTVVVKSDDQAAEEQSKR
jgi:hypothetical protein